MAFSGFAFLDTETTGIVPVRDSILEIGIVLVDAGYNEIASKHWITKTPGSNGALQDLYKSGDRDDEYVQNMHLTSGLKEDFEAARTKTPSFYVNAITSWLSEHDATGMPMCGNTISFDRNFLRVHYPEIDDAFHYRSIDVSGIREFYRTRYPAVAESVKEKVQEVMGIKDTQHRTISDCRWSMETLRAFDEMSMSQVRYER